MQNIIFGIIIIILIQNLFALGSKRILTVIRITAFQGILLGVLALLVHEHITLATIISSIAAMLLKGFIIPSIMFRAMRDVKIKKEIQPFISFGPSVIIGAVSIGLIFFLAGRLIPSGQNHAEVIIPAAISTIVTGLILMVTRYKAITQVLGYLIMENGIFLFSLLLIVAIPLVVEMGMLLDLFVSVFIISIITNHINEAFSSLDTRRLSALKE